MKNTWKNVFVPNLEKSVEENSLKRCCGKASVYKSSDICSILKKLTEICWKESFHGNVLNCFGIFVTFYKHFSTFATLNCDANFSFDFFMCMLKTPRSFNIFSKKKSFTLLTPILCITLFCSTHKTLIQDNQNDNFFLLHSFNLFISLLYASLLLTKIIPRAKQNVHTKSLGTNCGHK